MTDPSVDGGDIFPGTGEMSRLMRAHDWASTPLGSPADWPDGLKIPLRMLLTSRFEMWLGWGDDLQFFYNDAYIPTLGVKHPSMLGRPFREVWAEVYADVADQVERVRAGEATWNDSLLLLLERSGYPEETYHSFSYSPLYGAGRSVEGMLCIVTEVTERVINERRLETLRRLGMELVGTRSRDEVSTAVRNILDRNRQDFPFALMFLNDEEREIGIACSDDAAHLVDPLRRRTRERPNGLTPLDDALGCPSGAWAVPPKEALVVEIPGASGQGPSGQLVLGLNPYRRQDRDVAGVANLLAGQISGALANVATLRAERRRADRIWTHSRDLLVTIGADGVFRSVSPAWTRILGHPVRSVVGRSYLDFLVAEDEAATADALSRAASGTDLTAFENRFRASDGTERWISWHTAMEGGLVFGYGRDITEQKNSAIALAQAEEALRHAQKMEAVGQLTGGIAHDFNNLLTGITGSIDLIRRRRNENNVVDIEKYLNIASTSASRAAALTQRLLAFSRRQPLDARPVEVPRLVEGVAELIRKSVGERIGLDLPAAEGIWLARCDPNQLESALLNLAINARDAMPKGGRLSIMAHNLSVAGVELARHRLSHPGDYVVISVADTGHGMSPDVLAKAFDPFFTTKPLGQGTGLGLSMIYGFARQSGGTVHIESTEGRGTTVHLYLPRSHGMPEAVVAPEPDLRDRPAVRQATVLIVEDEAHVRALMVEALSELGYTTLEATDGNSGLEVLNSAVPIDLLITDVGLPGLNGRQMADAGRVTRRDLKVLFVTGYAEDAAIQEGDLEPGMELLTKPFTLDVLAERVSAVLEGDLHKLGSRPGATG